MEVASLNKLNKQILLVRSVVIILYAMHSSKVKIVKMCKYVCMLDPLILDVVLVLYRV
jgi:hypothetical protein